MVALGAALTHEGAKVPPLLCSTAPAVLLLASSAVVSNAVWYGIEPPAPPATFVAVVAVRALTAAADAHDGAAVPPLLFSTYPAGLLASSAVAPADVWYGIDPPAPPAMFAAVTAFVALAAVIDDELVHDGAAGPLLCSTAPATPLARSAVLLSPVWYGRYPAAPPLMLLATVAVAALMDK